MHTIKILGTNAEMDLCKIGTNITAAVNHSNIVPPWGMFSASAARKWEMCSNTHHQNLKNSPAVPTA